MRTSVLFFFLILLTPLSSISQTSSKNVFINGYLKGGEKKKIFITSQSGNDTIQCDQEGHFIYAGLKENSQGTIQLKVQDGIQFELFLAPGFDLTIKASIATIDSFYHSLYLSGIGAQTNLYWKQNYTLAKSYNILPLTDNWYNIPPKQFAQQGLDKLRLDSFSNAIDTTVFSSVNKEPYATAFKEQLRISIQFRKLYYAFAYAYMNQSSTYYIDSLLTQYINPDCFKHLSHDDLLSDFYYTQSISFYYPGYLVDTAARHRPEINEDRLKEILEVVCSIYIGKTKDYVLNKIIRKGISNTYSQSQLDTIKKFILKISDENMQSTLQLYCSQRKENIRTVNKGMPAPSFSLPDGKGAMHRLDDFIGKVVYIDLWASWCGPCKEELPYLKKIFDKFRDVHDLVIISIAVKDTVGATLRDQLVKNQHLEWLFLEDKDDLVWKEYKALAIPRFIMISKEGKIIDFDAPRPSEEEKLSKAIKDALDG